MKKHLKVATIAILSALFFTTVTATSPTFAAGACESGVDAVKTAAGCEPTVSGGVVFYSYDWPPI